MMRELLADLTRTLEAHRACVYCSVVETRGSTPQKAGAAMLVLPDGSQRGTLGGGCMEAEVKQRALQVMAEGTGQPQVLKFCLDDDYGWDDGLICGGRMSILAAPLFPETGNGISPVITYFRHFQQLVESGRGATEAVLIATADGTTLGSRYLFDASGELVAQLADSGPSEVVTGGLTPLHLRPAASVKQGIAYLPVLPRIHLLIVGGGHVGQAVAKLAAEVEFDVTVLDDRASYVGRDRFPSATRLLVGDIGAELRRLAAEEIDPSTYGIVVTRGHNHDEEALYHLAPTAAGYVGMIGSKRKIKLIFEDLMARGLTAEMLERVHAPLGLAIGSQTVPEIAISIVAELIARRNLGAGTPRDLPHEGRRRNPLSPPAPLPHEGGGGSKTGGSFGEGQTGATLPTSPTRSQGFCS